MTREEFIELLEENEYSYQIEGNKVVVTYREGVYLTRITSLPPGVEFRNGESVYLTRITSLPPGVEFNNLSHVHLISLTSISPGVEFNNKKDVFLVSLTGDWFSEWEGNIEGINSKRVLNKMIKDGVFER